METRIKPITGRKIRFALIGCGRISKNHVGALDAHADDAELVAICDNQTQRLDAIRDGRDVAAFTSLEELYANADFDCAIVCTPSGLHATHTIQSAEHGKHVVTEKPMATRWRSAIRMVEACDAAGVQLFVVKQNRRNATLQLLKDAIRNKRFGRIYMVTINVFWTRPQEYYDQDAWRGTWEFDGGALMNQASHYVDLVDWLIGPVESVQAYTATLGRDIEVEDTASVIVRWRSGAIGSLNATMLTYPKNFEGSITILGEKGTVRIGGVAVNEIQRWEFADSVEGDEDIRSANYETTSVYGFGHPLYYENVIQTLRGETLAHTDGREGLKSMELLIATYLSARDGKAVSLPLQY